MNEQNSGPGSGPARPAEPRLVELRKVALNVSERLATISREIGGLGSFEKNVLNRAARELREACRAASAVALPADRGDQARFNMMRFVSRVRRACNMGSMASIREAVRQLNADNAALPPLDEPSLIRSPAAAEPRPETPHEHDWQRKGQFGLMEFCTCGASRIVPASVAVSDPEDAVEREIVRLYGPALAEDARPVLAPLIAAAYDKGASEARQTASRLITSINAAHERELAAARAELETAKQSIGLNALAAQVHAAQQKWWQVPRNKGELLMLIVSEVAEAFEGERKSLMDDKLPNRRMAEVELADTIIRILDYCGAYGYDLDGAYREKMAFNAERADHKKEASAINAGGNPLDAARASRLQEPKP